MSIIYLGSILTRFGNRESRNSRKLNRFMNATGGSWSNVLPHKDKYVRLVRIDSSLVGSDCNDRRMIVKDAVSFGSVNSP